MHDHENMDHSQEGTPKEYAKFAIVILGILLLSWGYASFSSVNFMTAFMGVFFVVFAIFKFLDLRGFVSSYIGYDLIAKRSTAYAYLYPFIELGLGIAYLSNAPAWINWVTLIIMLIGAIGVQKQLFRGSKIKCACLGTYIKLPLTTVSLTENLLMAAMAFYVIIK